MPTVIRTTHAAVLAALNDLLVTGLEWPQERILRVADEHEGRESFDPHGDQYLLIRARALRWDRNRYGGGRLDTRVRRRCTITLRTRLLLDPSSEDAAWLLDADRGHHVTEHTLFGLIEGVFLADEDDNLFLHEPMHPEEASQAERPRKRSGWGDSSISLDLCYTLSLSTAATY